MEFYLTGLAFSEDIEGDDFSWTVLFHQSAEQITGSDADAVDVGAEVAHLEYFVSGRVFEDLSDDEMFRFIFGYNSDEAFLFAEGAPFLEGAPAALKCSEGDVVVVIDIL